MKSEHIHKVSEDEKYEAYKIFFGTLASQPRLKILNALKHEHKCVSELTEELDMEQTSVSHNLKRLQKCGFITRKKQGKYRYYNIDKQRIKPVLELVDNHMQDYCVHIHRGTR